MPTPRKNLQHDRTLKYGERPSEIKDDRPDREDSVTYDVDDTKTTNENWYRFPLCGQDDP